MASQAIDVSYGGTETSEQYPKGCYMYFSSDELSSETYWNDHAIGSLRKPRSRNLCRKYIGIKTNHIYILCIIIIPFEILNIKLKLWSPFKLSLDEDTDINKNENSDTSCPSAEQSGKWVNRRDNLIYLCI